jgi:hypothetical protein
MAFSWIEQWKRPKWIKAGGLLLALMSALLLTYGGEWQVASGQESPIETPETAAPEPVTPDPGVPEPVAPALAPESPLAVPPTETAPAAPALLEPVILPSLSGVIRNVDGAPVGGMVVTAYRRQQDAWIQARQTTTTELGEYHFPWMPSGFYRLHVKDPNGLYAFAYYPSAGDIEVASDIPITGQSVEGINLQVDAAAQISGTLTWREGPSPFDSTVALYRVTSAPITTRVSSSDNLALSPDLRQYRLIERQRFTETNVLFGFTGLAAGSYRVCAEATTLHNSSHECFNNAALGIHGTDVVATPGQTIRNVTITLGDKADLATLTGTVVLTDGIPAVGVTIEVVPQPNVDFFAAPQPQNTKTDAAGNFHFDELPFGSYKLELTDPAGTYRPRTYREPADAAEPTLIVLDRASVVTVETTIQLASQIRGNVTIDGVNAGMNGQVTAYNLTPEGSWALAGSGPLVAATGAYTVPGLVGGIYRVQVQVDLPVQIFYGGATLETAADVEVLTGTVASDINIDITPYIANVPYGTISGAVIVDGAPQPNLQVSIYPAGFDCCTAPAPLITTTTNMEGAYTVSGLPAGQYKVGVSDPNQLYATIYAPDQPTFATAALFVIGNPADGVARQTILDANSSLAAGGSVVRTIVRPDDTPVEGATVNLYQNVGDPAQFQYPLVASTVTNANGIYSFRGLAPNLYQVCILAPGITETTCGGGNGQGLGIDVVVTAGQEATGIDILNIPAPAAP